MIYNKDRLKGKALTVQGLMDPNKLGIVMPHEHCLIDGSAVYPTPPKEASLLNFFYQPVSIDTLAGIRYGGINIDNTVMLDENTTCEELRRYTRQGGNTLADATIKGLGQDPDALLRISRRTDINIIMGCGYYVWPTIKDIVSEDTEIDQYAREMIDSIFKGTPTGIHSGMIGEIGCSWPLHPVEKKVLFAAGLAQKATGAGLHVHPGRSDTAPFELIDILKEAGADLGKVAIDHMDRCLQKPENRYRVLDEGCFVEYDFWGMDCYYPSAYEPFDIPSDMQRIALVRDILDKGYGDQILISIDMDQKSRLAKYGGHGYDHILTNAVPAMRLRGFSQDELDMILQRNPQRFLTFA